MLYYLVAYNFLSGLSGGLLPLNSQAFAPHHFWPLTTQSAGEALSSGQAQAG